MRQLMAAGAAAGVGFLMEKQSLVPVVQELWNTWEIHAMILTSLFLQVFLFLFAGLRQRSSNVVLRTVLWLAYLSADSVAVFVLGHLAVRTREPGHQLMSFWAPFVLVHLGGQDTITAFAKQDNELWRRHLLNLVVQAGVAAYVVGKTSWPDKRLKAAMVLVFLCGCVKYIERTYMLYQADPSMLRSWATDSLLSKLGVRGLFIVGFIADLIFLPSRKEQANNKKKQDSMKEVIEKTEHRLATMSKGSWVPQHQLYQDAILLTKDIISVDAPINLANNISVVASKDPQLAAMLKVFKFREDHHNAYEHVGALLGHCYRRLYTKDDIRESCMATFFMDIRPLVAKIYVCFWTVLYALFPFVSISVALVLFMAAEKEDQGQQVHASSRVDVIVSYLLLVGAIALDVSSAASFIFFHSSIRLSACVLNPLPTCIRPAWHSSKQWSQKLGQYNMVRNARMCQHPVWRWIFAVQHPSIARDKSPIKKFILDTLLASGAREEWSIASKRGRGALPHHRDKQTVEDSCQKHDDQQYASSSASPATAVVEDTVTSGVDLPISVLILHIATDICYYFNEGTTSSSPDDQVAKIFKKVKKLKQISRELSNYIMYLVFKCDVMLTTNSQLLHDKAFHEIRKILLDQDELEEKEAVMKVYGQADSIEVEDLEDLEDQQAADPTTAQIQVVHIVSDGTDSNADDYNHMDKLLRNTQTLKSPVLPRARKVAKELISIKDEAARWDFIAKVWAGMLYYVAPRCGGGFHYEHLSEGGEFATHVLVLMYYLGPFMPPPDA